MDKRQFTRLALAGIVSGLLVTQEATAADAPAKTDKDIENANGSNMGYHLMTEDELLLELNPQGEALYNSLTKEGKDLALTVASQRCNGTNQCKGLNACQTDNNACAGQGSCKGKGKCSFSDKNLAVKVVASHMKNKRAQAAN